MKDVLDEEYFNLLQMIENSSKRLAWTIDLIINMAQIHTGNLSIKKTRFNLNYLLSKLKHEFQSVADEKSLYFEIIFPETDLIVSADEYTVEKVLVNLLDNAFKFTTKGGIKVELSEEEGKKLIQISDTGQGISDNYMDNLFTPFTQQEMGYSRSIDGLGLGLALVKTFTEMNDIDLEVKSEPGKGTQFRLLFK
jgi:signal transduction histidine kinase